MTGISGALYLLYDDMSLLAGIHWSAPSPIEWGILILAGTILLHHNSVKIFEAYYMAVITAMGGGWLYEFIPTLFYRFNPLVFLKVNAVKVFFIEFQLFSLPIVAWIIYRTKEYKPHKLLGPIILFTAPFYAANPLIIQWVQANMILSYRWWVRLPAILFLFTVLAGVKGEKQDA